MSQTYNLKRVHKVNLIAVYIIASVFILQNLIFGKGAIQDILSAIVIMVIATVLFFLPIHNLLKGFLLGFVPTLTVYALMFIQEFSIANHYIFFVSISMIALYFEARLILIYA
ncbi:MAG: hypothetical protein PF505_12065 [Vallitaleaceae bacterium]|jgi:methyl-accepting chemotaxis protein|nr:hypothetical protein [Vallitaleaceae bacterium]